VRHTQAISSLRLLKLCRYYDGAALLARALSRSLQQLTVPLFMLMIMMFSFACIMCEIEWDVDIDACESSSTPWLTRTALPPYAALSDH
jgi:hypothetical protein